MHRQFVGLALAVGILTGCTAQPSATVPTVVPSAAPTTPTRTASRAAATPSPFPTVAAFPASTPIAGVPAGIEHVAWAGAQLEGTGDTAAWHVLAGLLNHQATVRVGLAGSGGSPWLVTAGDVVGIVSAGERSTHITVHRASGGAALGSIDLGGAMSREIAIDPDHELLYAAVALQTGGVAIHRLSFDGSHDVVLVKLDERFTPDGIPTERFDLTLDPDGVLIIDACAKTDGCRLWEIPPTATKAGSPQTLPGKPPVVCYAIAATRTWIIVADDDVCWADTGDARLPIRAIRRSDGVSHLVTDDHVSIGRVFDIDGRTALVGADGAYAEATVDIATYDVGSGAKEVILRHVPPTASGETVAVSTAKLPAPWVLLVPWFVPGDRLPELPGRLLNVETGALIELPLGTSGWS